MNPGGSKKIFVLYHENDRNWAEWIAWLLEEDGLNSIVPDWDFRAGYHVAKEMRKAIDEAQRVIVIISPDYLDTRNMQWSLVFNREMLSREGAVLPIIVRDCGTPLRKPLDTLVSINLVGRDVLHTSEKLRKAIRMMRTKPTTPPIFPLEALYQEVHTTGGRQSNREHDFQRDQQKETKTGGARSDIPAMNPLVTQAFDTSSGGATKSLFQRAELVESAFDQKDWMDVIRKSKLLIQHSLPGSVSWKIYRMQALAYHAQGKEIEARESLEIALALVTDKKERLALLDEYTNALSSLKRWQEMLVYADEALTLVPNDIRWQALRDQITLQINLEKPRKGEEPFYESPITNPTVEAQAWDETILASNLPKGLNQRVNDLKEVAPDHQETISADQTVIVTPTRITIFIAYSPTDLDLCAELKNQLTSLEYQYQLAVRYDHDISAGRDRLRSIEEHLRKAQIIILLLSASFLGSTYHRWQIELALKRSQTSTARVIPVLLRPSDWEKTPLGGLQALPKENRAITESGRGISKRCPGDSSGY